MDDMVGGVIELRLGTAEATIQPGVGGRLSQLDLGGGPLLRGRARGLSWAEWGSYILAPWSNRIPGGRLDGPGARAQLPVNWEDGSAIHGLVAATPWRVAEQSATRAQLETEVSCDPWQLRITTIYELDGEGLHQTLTVVNAGERAVPIGMGIHPWFRVGAVRVPATLKWPGDPLPVGPVMDVDADDDLRTARRPPVMDRCFTGLTDTSVDAPGVRLHWTGPVTNVVVYSGDPNWVSVEPVTMANDGFNLAIQGIEPHGVIMLAPAHAAEVGYRFERRE